MRGGYVEFTNIHPKSMEELYKIVSINLSPNGVGQVGQERGKGLGGVCVWGGVLYLFEVAHNRWGSIAWPALLWPAKNWGLAGKAC